MIMFDEFLKNCKPEDEILPSEARVEKNLASLRSLIEKEEKQVPKRKLGIKPLIIAAAAAILSGVSLLSVSAAIQKTTINFIMGGSEIEGEYYDYVDSEGYRQMSFEAVLPLDEHNYAIIFDVDAPRGENVRVITDETDPDFMERLRSFIEARHNSPKTEPSDPDPKDFGLVLKNSELCKYEWSKNSNGLVGSGGGVLLGEFDRISIASGKPSGYGEHFTYDHENNTTTLQINFYYYVGKE